MTRTVTIHQLRDTGACYEQRVMFRNHFGEGVNVTVEDAMAVACDFDWRWAAVNLLTRKGTRYFCDKMSKLDMDTMDYVDFKKAQARAWAEAYNANRKWWDMRPINGEV